MPPHTPLGRGMMPLPPAWRCLRFAKATPTREAEEAAAVDAKRLTDEENMDGTGAEPRFRLLIKSAARKLRVGRGFAAPLNERFSCLSVKPLGGLDGANSAERGLSSFWQGRRCLPCLYISIFSRNCCMK